MIAALFLVTWALRSAILILSGAVLLKTLRVNDPSVRLAAWTAMLCGSLAIPLLTVELPAMPVGTRGPVAAPRPAANRVAPAKAVAIFRPEEHSVPAPHRFDWAGAAVNAYGAVVAVLLLRLGIGLAMSWRLLRYSQPTHRAGVRESERVSSPVTVGILWPSIVLPADWRMWDAAKLAAVLAHERSHIRRHDPAVQLLSAIHRALLWHSPLSWYLDRQIVRLAEQASDDAALAVIRDRASYAEMLLEFMQRGVRRSSLQAVPMARYAEPEQRIHRILDTSTLSRGITRWSVAAILALGMPLAYVVAAAQERLTFEAASVKPAVVPPGVSVSGTSTRMTGGSRADFERLTHNTGGPGTTDPGRIHYPLETLKGLLRNAYTSYFEIVAPDWADTDTVSVDATMPPDTTKKQFHEMLQNLLIDRFNLKTHVGTKEIRGYVLALAKTGPKLKDTEVSPSETPGDGTPQQRSHEIGPDGFSVPPRRIGEGFLFNGMPGERARMMGQQKTMDDLAGALGKLLDSKVIDATGLNGKYDITLTYAGHLGGPNGVQALLQPPSASADPSAPEPLPDIFSALQSQLGLKLEAKKIAVEILVVDRMEKTPSGN